MRARGWYLGEREEGQVGEAQQGVEEDIFRWWWGVVLLFDFGFDFGSPG